MSAALSCSVRMRRHFWARGRRSTGAIEPEVSTRKTRCAGLRSRLCTSRPFSATFTSVRVRSKGDGAPSTCTAKGASDGAASRYLKALTHSSTRTLAGSGSPLASSTRRA